MIENELVKRNIKTDNNEKQSNLLKTNETFFKEKKSFKFEPKTTRFPKKTSLKLPSAHLNAKLNLSDSVLTFTDSAGFYNEKLTSSQNNLKIKKIKFKDSKLEEETFNGPLTNSITKWSSQLTPIKLSETKVLAKNAESAKNTAIIEYKQEKKTRLEAKLVLEPPAEINRLMDIIDRENTNFSIKIAYDNLFAQREDATTPHTYLHLDIDPNLALARENTIKNMNFLEPEHFKMLRQKTMNTPGIYQTIKRPTQNLYSELVLLDELYKKNNKRTSPIKTVKKKSIPKASFKKDKFINYQSLDFLESGLNTSLNTEREDDKSVSIQMDSNDPYALNNNLTHSTNSMIDSQEKLGNKNYQKNNDLILLEGFAQSIRLKESLKESPMYNKKSPTKQRKTTTSNTKQNKKLALKEFKYCILTDLKIGEGEFSETFQGYRYDMGAPIKIAAKRLKIAKEKDEQNVQNLLSEIAVLTQLGKHNYVIDFLGVHNHLDTMYLIFEYAEKGDLKRLLDLCRKSSRRETLLNNMYKIRIAYEIASGMEYISSLDIVHKDLAARNVLLDKDYSCKISDFGCCKAEFLTKMPIRWMAPESLNKLLFSTASDVWSYGILLWELYTYGITPYPGMTDDEVIGRINQWYRLYKPQDCPNEVYAIMLSCWKDYHKARPRFTLIKNKFRDLYKVANDPHQAFTTN